MSFRIPMVGRVFGELSVIEFSHQDTAYKNHWQVRCSCGKTLVCDGSDLRQGKSTRCDECRRKKLSETMRKHDMSGSPIYTIWNAIMSRCYNPNNKDYKRYGARGITVCDRWHDPQNFHEDMGDRPEGLTIDRIDNYKGYSKENCRWVTHQENCNNRRPRSEWVFKTANQEPKTI